MQRLTMLVLLLALSMACANTAGADAAGEWRTLHDGIYTDALRRSCESQGDGSPLHFCIGRERAKLDTGGACGEFQYRKPDDIPAGELAVLLGAFDYCLQTGQVQ